MKVKVVINGKTYEVEYENTEQNSSSPLTDAGRVQSLVLPTPQTPSSERSDIDESKVCCSPVAGVVVRVNVESGQSVQAEEIVLVVEAMKMEHNLTAPTATKVTAVRVKVGDTVKSGQILVEFE